MLQFYHANIRFGAFLLLMFQMFVRFQVIDLVSKKYLGKLKKLYMNITQCPFQKLKYDVFKRTTIRCEHCSAGEQHSQTRVETYASEM